MNFIYDYIYFYIFILPITFEPLKTVPLGGLCIKMVVIPKYFMSISSWLFHFNSILVAYSAEIIKNCVSVQIYMDLTVCVYIKFI